MERLKLIDVFSDNYKLENTEVEGGSISSLSSDRVDKVIIGCTFLDEIEINLNGSANVIFNNCIFNDKITFDLRGSFSKLVFNHCTFKTFIFINQVNSFEMNQCKVECRLEFKDFATKDIKIYKTIIEKLSFGSFENNPPCKVQLDDLDCSHLFVKQKTAENLRIWKGNYAKIEMNHLTNFKKIQIFGDEKIGEKIKIKTFKANFLNLENSIVIKNALIDNWDISHFNINNGKLRLQNVIFQVSLISIESNLAGAQFNNVSFQAAKLFFDWSYIAEVKFSNIIWPKKHEVCSVIEEETNEESKIQILRSKTEVYRQLKKASIDSNNQIDKLKFQRNELDTYWQRVKIDKSESRTNRFLLRIDRLFSNFGQDYLRPIAWLLSVQFILCCLIWWREDVYHNYDAASYAKAFEDGFAQYVTMIIPVFKTPEYWTGTSLTLSVIIRLFNALLIYHFIRAVHKFGKN